MNGKHPYSWIESLNNVTLSAPPRVICRFNTTPLKTPTLFFGRNGKANLEIHVELAPSNQNYLKMD